MVHRQDARSAAQRYAGDHVDADDPNMEREHALVEDGIYQSLAVALEQLDELDFHCDLPLHESTFANTARKNLELALEERVSTVLEGVDGVETPDEMFDPGDYDNVREALQDAPVGYGVEKVIDHFDPAVDGEVTRDD